MALGYTRVGKTMNFSAQSVINPHLQNAMCISKVKIPYEKISVLLNTDILN